MVCTHAAIVVDCCALVKNYFYWVMTNNQRFTMRALRSKEPQSINSC